MCGISGYIAKDEITIQKSIIKTLGVFNDSRGGDSCGLFIDGNVEYGVDNKKLFSDFIDESKLLSKNIKTKVVLSHCRKRSVGIISLETAQPVVIRNKEGLVDFCLIHNGTIHNAEELWKKHNATPLDTSMTDSQKMAYLFYNYGYNDLANYNGAAVFVIVDYRRNRDNPEVLFFKGCSLENYIAKTPSEERPLFIAIDKKMLLFSSIAISLKCVTEQEVLTIKPNSLCRFNGENIVVIKEFDRRKKMQCREHVKTTYAWENTRDDYDDYYGDSGFGYKNNRKKSFIGQNNSGKAWDGSKKLDYRIGEGKTYMQYKPAHGKYTASCFGYTTTSFDVADIWFYDGYLLKGGEQAFNFLKYIHTLNKELCPTDGEFSDLFISIIRKYSALPIWNNLSKKYETEPEYGNIIPFIGKFVIPFNSDYKIINIEDGTVKETSIGSYYTIKESFNKLNEEINSYPFNWMDEKKSYETFFELTK